MLEQNNEIFDFFLWPVDKSNSILLKNDSVGQTGLFDGSMPCTVCLTSLPVPDLFNDQKLEPNYRDRFDPVCYFL